MDLENNANKQGTRIGGGYMVVVVRSFFFLRSFFLRKITIMASVSKLFLAQTDRMGKKFFRPIFFLTARTQKLETGQKKLPILAPVSKHSETPKNRIARFFFEKCVFENFWA